VNTRRLLVTGTRIPMPGWTSRPKDPAPPAATYLLIVLWMAGIARLIPFGRKETT